MLRVDGLDDVRIRAGLTQQELADLVGVTQATINRYEKEERTPRPATLGRLADALGVEEWFGRSIPYHSFRNISRRVPAPSA